jgi:hypothetical protein
MQNEVQEHKTWKMGAISVCLLKQLRPLLRTWTFVTYLCTLVFHLFRFSEQTSSLQVVLESSNDQDHADGNVECRDISRY